MKIKCLVSLSALLLLNANLLDAQTPGRLEAKAARIHSRLFTVDSHTDAPLRFNNKQFDIARDNTRTVRNSCVDFPRMRKGGLDAVFLAVFIGQGPRSPEGNAKAKYRADAIFDSIHSACRRNEAICGIATTPEQAYKLNEQKKSVVFIGVENGYPIGNDLSNVEYFYQRGARYITLCHSKNNDICSSSTDTSNQTGLTPFGIEVVKEMNRLGMMVDVSHLSDQSFYDVLNTSKSPVIASHSCARALCDNPRNLTDEMLRALAANNGVIQMCILSAYVKTPDPNPQRDQAMQALRAKWGNFQNLDDAQQAIAFGEWDSISARYPQKLASVSDAVDHIDHIVKVAGIDHVGIGTDFDGGGGLSDCRDVSQLGNITAELVKRGYSKKEIQKIWGENLMRVMNEVAPKASLVN